MRFFTPELFARYNSPDDATADAADADWEEALAAYRGHLADVLVDAPPGVSELAALDLHDAEVALLPQHNPTLAAIVAQRGGEYLMLCYRLRGEVGVSTPPRDWPFSPGRVHWLYDEIDRGPEGGWLHRVLLSDGPAVAVPFDAASVGVGPVPATA